MESKIATMPKGYAKKPWELYVLPWVFIAAPLLNWFFWWVTYQSGGQMSDPIMVLAVNFGSFDKGIWGLVFFISLLIPWSLSLVTAIGLWRVRPWGFWLCAITGLLAWFASAWNFGYTENAPVVFAPVFNPLQPAALTNLLFFLPVLFLLQRDLVAPFFESHLRWWEQNKRLKLQLPLEVHLPAGTSTLKTFDISLNGCFLELTDETIPMDQDYKALLDLMDGGAKVEILLKILWKTEGSRFYPAGLGCQFNFKSSFPKQRLELYLKKHLQMGQKPHIRA